MIYPVNDGENTHYSHDSAKERLIAYIKNVVDGKEKTIYESIQEALDSLDEE